MTGEPDVDVVDEPDRVRVLADLPGFSEDDIELRGSGDHLRITGDRSLDVGEAARIERQERSPNADREIDLPARTHVDEAEATFENGVLEVRLPKYEEDHETVIGIQ